mmetsp:Transcript_12971/g.17479  ORF Transcript_12971/g.17479 Transcript_12971/m.17479 type:complete len:80 (+) Transcript_12971:405-644(+)
MLYLITVPVVIGLELFGDLLALSLQLLFVLLPFFALASLPLGMLDLLPGHSLEASLFVFGGGRQACFPSMVQRLYLLLE